MKTASWVIIEITTDKAVFETFNESTANKINTKKYKSLSIIEYLQSLNKNSQGYENRTR